MVKNIARDVKKWYNYVCKYLIKGDFSMLEKYYKIKLEYFDYSGNSCGEGIITTTKSHMFEIYEEVEFLKNNHLLPNISSNRDIVIYINAENHPNGYPLLYGLEDFNYVNSKNTIPDIDLGADNSDIEVNLEYFKHTGKYYTEDVINIKGSNARNVVASICELKNKNRLPGVSNPKDFILYMSTIQNNRKFKQLIF